MADCFDAVKGHETATPNHIPPTVLVGEIYDVRDSYGFWAEASILDQNEEKKTFRVHFLHWFVFFPPSLSPS